MSSLEICCLHFLLQVGTNNFETNTRKLFFEFLAHLHNTSVQPDAETVEVPRVVCEYRHTHTMVANMDAVTIEMLMAVMTWMIVPGPVTPSQLG